MNSNDLPIRTCAAEQERVMKIQRLVGATMFMIGATSFAFGSPFFIPLAAFGLLLFIEAVVIIGRSE